MKKEESGHVIIADGLREGYENGAANFAYLEALARGCTPHAAVRIPKGNYNVWNEAALSLYGALMRGKISPDESDMWKACRNIALPFHDAEDIALDGQGSTLVFDGLIQPFQFMGCRGVSLRNLHIDWGRPLFSTGKVLEVTENSMTLRMDQADLEGGEPVVSYQDYDAEGGVRPGGICEFSGISNLAHTGNKTVQVRCEHRLAVAPGANVILRHIYNYAPAIHLFHSSDIVLDNVSIHAVPGMGIIGHCCKDIHIKNLSVCPTHGRPMSTNCDATHFISCEGELVIEDSFFEAMGDDATNVHGFYYLVDSVESRSCLCLAAGAITQDTEPDIPAAGDEIAFVRRATLEPYAEGRIHAVRWDGESRAFVAELTSPVPEAFDITDVIANRTKTARLAFSRCTVQNIRGRAVLIQSPNAVIDHCHFEHCTGQGVHVDTAEGWWESMGTKNVLIENNRFFDCGYGKTKYCDAVAVVVETEAQKPWVGIHKHIIIRDNDIEGQNVGIAIRCAEDVRLENNRFSRCEPFLTVAHARGVFIG